MDESLGIGTLERQVIEAALRTTRPSSSAKERAEASSSLEQWTAGTNNNASSGGGGAATVDTACWEAYIHIIRIISCCGNSTGQPLDGSSGHSSSAPSTSNNSTHSGSGSCSVDSSNIVEKIAYATSPSSKSLQPLTNNLELQIQREANGAKLLLLTLLCNKIRREYLRVMQHHPLVANQVFDELLIALQSLGNIEQYQQQQQQQNSVHSMSGWTELVAACCSAVAAVAVRASSPQHHTNEGIMHITLSCQASIAASLGVAINDLPPNNNSSTTLMQFPPSVALRLLADIPQESTSRNDLTTVGIDALLEMPHADVTLQTLQMALSGYYMNGSGEIHDALLCSTLKALSKWAEASKNISVSRLSGNNNTILSHLVALLSSQSQQRQWSSAGHAEKAIVTSAKALDSCIENSSDFGTGSRRAAVSSLLASITAPTEFIIAPLKIAEQHQWEDATVALSNLTSTLAREDIDEVATCQLPGCTELIELLLNLQSHPIHNVAVPVLEVWLTLQDVPTCDRHPNLASPLYMQLTETILNRVAYPSSFVSWEEELDVEQSDFEEMRRLSTDVLVGAYFLLRSGYLETLANVVMTIDGGDWEVVESALFCLSAVGREACARVKSVRNMVSSGRDSPVAADGEATSVGLTQVVGSICAGGISSISRRNPLVLAGIANFLGSYSTVWASSCPPQSIIEILGYLSAALSVPAATEAAGKSIRLVLIASASKLTKAAASPGADISVALTQCIEAALTTNNAIVMSSVAEGCARVSVALGDTAKTRATLSAVAAPAIHCARSVLDAIISSSSVQGSGQAAGQVESASQQLACYLGVLKEIIRFCDASGREGESHVLSDVLSAAWPVLNDISSNATCRANEAVLSGLLDVHSQLLSVVPSLIGPYFKDLITFVVKAYEEAFCPSALDYVSAAVETFDTEQSIGAAAGLDDAGKEMIFNQLLAHLCQCTFTYVTQTKPPSECPQVIKSLFEMSQRYLLFSPGALCQCPEFASLFGLAVACLTECKGETMSTRATLIFLTQLIGWKNIRLQDAKMTKLAQFGGAIDNLLSQHGETIIKACLGALSGSAPQILWPSYSECLFSIMLHIISSTPGADDPNSVLCTWLRTAMNDSSSMASDITPEVATSVIKILCDLAKEGSTSKQKAKMALMDFGKIAKGEATSDALLAYTVA